MQQIDSNCVRILRVPDEFAVGMTRQPDGETITAEVHYRGRKIFEECFNPCAPLRTGVRDPLTNEPVDLTKCWIRALDASGRVLADTGRPAGEEQLYPYMVLQGEQVHITEHYVSVPPACTITDEAGDIWTLGFHTAPMERAPQGEFAFDVLRNGQYAGEIASRIERRGGKVRCFTRRQGWKVWNGREFL